MDREWRHFQNTVRLSADMQSSAAVAMGYLDAWADAAAEVRGSPEYRPQPLWPLPARARRLDIADLYYKDESRRFGRALGSFKALGATYAVYSLLRDAVEDEAGVVPTSQDLRSGKFRDSTSSITVCVATDGNQGRALAHAAQALGCRCVVYVHRDVSPGRKTAMERLGAVVIRTDSGYEESVTRAKTDAARSGWHFVSSTSWNDYADLIPRRVMHGYMILVEEAVAQVPSPKSLTHVVMQGGVGSIAAAIFFGFARLVPDAATRFVVVEPAEADCLYRSAVSGRPTRSAGTLNTMMAGLACAEVSPAAWKILWAAEGMRALADGDRDVPIVAGESAAGGMGVLLHAEGDPALRAALGLGQDSRVLLIGGEGATDPVIYEDLTGQAPDEVFARQATVTAARR